MPKEFSRTSRVAEQIQRELAPLLQDQARVAGNAMVTLSTVRVTSDLSTAKVYFTVLGDANADDVLRVLRRSAGHFRHELARRLYLRAMPRIEFHRDEVLERGMHVAELIEAAVSADKNAHQP